MNDQALIEKTVREATGQTFSIASRSSIGGGCINDAFKLKGESGTYFVKTNRLSFEPAFEAERQALEELAGTATVRVPQVIAQVSGETQVYLILEYIETRTSRCGDWGRLGRQLARLHQLRQPYYGWSRDNWIGATQQPNPRSEDWIDFFRTHRIERQIELCRSKGFDVPGAERLLEAIPDLLAKHEAWPSLLHGDLWSGNAAFDETGQPFLFDPGSYYGDRETDIAFTEFFGGFSREFYDAYNEALPLAPGYETRKTLYNLYHCLNHVYIFGGSYAHQATLMTRQLLDAVE